MDTSERKMKASIKASGGASAFTKGEIKKNNVPGSATAYSKDSGRESVGAKERLPDFPVVGSRERGEKENRPRVVTFSSPVLQTEPGGLFSPPTVHKGTCTYIYT